MPREERVFHLIAYWFKIKDERQIIVLLVRTIIKHYTKDIQITLSLSVLTLALDVHASYSIEMFINDLKIM